MATLRDQNTEAVVVSSVGQVKAMLGREAKTAAVSSIKARKKAVTASLDLFGGTGSGFYGGGRGFGNAGHTMGDATNMYSPHLSTDFLELPQNVTEARSYYRFFYNNDPYVGQAIDLHTELPLSKLRLGLPKGKDPKKNREILQFFEDMVKRLNLLHLLIDATREYYVIGEAFIFAEDSEIEVPEYVYMEKIRRIDPETGETFEAIQRREKADELIEQYRRKTYQGWDRIILLPPDQVDVKSMQYSSSVRIELLPDDKVKSLVQAAAVGDPEALDAIKDIPEDILDYILEGKNLPLSTNPDEGSFVYHLARKKPPGEDHGISLLHRCLRTLVYRDKLRQSQTSIASRAMTPKRLIYAEDMSEADVEDLREQVDLALLDPDYSIISNFQINWEEISARDRLLDLNGEYDITDRQLFAGLGVTESMLTGESSYSGERINIEVINTRYMLYRDQIQQYVEEQLFRPVAEHKGFFEIDEFGNKRVLYPSLSFTRLALRDNRDTFDAMFNLYQKGSLSVGYILELFNLDPQAVEERLRADLMTVNDAMFNEIIRAAYSEVGRAVPEKSDMTSRVIRYLQLTETDGTDENDRWS